MTRSARNAPMTNAGVVVGLLLSATVLAAPRTDGIYVAPSHVGLIDSPAVSADELGLIEYLSFTPKSVTVHFVVESTTFEVRAAKGGLEVKQGSDWAPLLWQELADGAVETDLLHGREQLRFVKGTLEKREQAAKQAFTRAQLKRLAGKYGEKDEAITLDASGGQRGKQRLALAATQCVPRCSTFFRSVCLTTPELVLLETAEGLLRLPAGFDLCVGYGSGIETEGGVALRRAKPAAGKGAVVSLRQLQDALTVRSEALRSCNKNAAPRKVELEVTVAPSGLVSRLLADDQQLSDCISVAVSRLTFPTQAASSTLTLEWTLPSP